MRFVGGPHAGQTVVVPRLRYDWSGPYIQGPIPYLVNVWDGDAVHCYLTVPNSREGYSWHLKYQETW